LITLAPGMLKPYSHMLD